MIVLIRGGGDLSSGVALRLYRAGLRLLITELPQPLAVRRLVSFAQAVYQGQVAIEGVIARRAADLAEALHIMQQDEIPVLVDPHAETLNTLRSSLSIHQPSSPLVLVDGRMTKQPIEPGIPDASLVIGLGPGFIAGMNCHAVVETHRGHQLGRVIWQGPAESDTGIPDKIAGRDVERALRAPADGKLHAHAEIGNHLEAGQLVAEVAQQAVRASFPGVLRGLIYPGLHVHTGMKIGDIDPRDDACACRLVSDKALAVGGGILEAILSRPELRPFMWE